MRDFLPNVRDIANHLLGYMGPWYLKHPFIKRLFQLDDSKSLHEKMVVSPFPVILKWMFRVPGPSDFFKDHFLEP